MATIEQKIDAERRMRDLIDGADLSQPDRIEYGYTCIRLFWNVARTVIVVDIDEREEAGDISAADPKQLAAGSSADKPSELSRGPEQRREHDAHDRHDQPDDPPLGLARDHDRGDRDADGDHSAGGDQANNEALEPGSTDLPSGEHVR